MQKGQAVILVLVGILVIIGVAGGAYYFGKSQVSKPLTQNPMVASQTPQATSAPSPAPDETANWKIYIDSNRRFSIKYPAEWGIWPSTQEVQIDGGKSETLDFSIRVNDLSKDGQSFINDEIEINKNTPNVYIEEHSKLSIGSLDTLQVRHTSDKLYPVNKGDKLNQIELFAFSGSKQVSITFLYVDPERLRIINLILSTFKFTN